MTSFVDEFTMTIGGAGRRGKSSFAIHNPANRSVVGEAPDCSPEDLDDAVAAARAAFPGWSALSIEERRKYLMDFAAAILAHLDPLKRLLTSEQGKPLADAEMEVGGAAMFLQGSASLTLPVEVIEDSEARYVETSYVPLGVVAAIAPWNFPVILAMFKIGPALLAGNTMVLKPSPFTPLTTLKIGEIARGILPSGVFNIVSGGDALGPWLTAHPDVDKVSFTGSTATGKKVVESAAATLKRVTLELGGNDAAIVLPDVDVERAAEQIFWSAFRNAGQICIASKRVYVHQDIYPAFAAAITAYAATVKLGDGAEQGTRIGPINNKPQFDRVVDLIRDAREQGLQFLTGGEPSATDGLFIPITIIDNPPEDARIVQEEQFGPIMPLIKVKSVDEAIDRANRSEFGLGNSVWSKDAGAAAAVARRLDSGIVWVNESQYLSPFIPFGGHKLSGLGVEGGLDGLKTFTATRTISINRKAWSGA